MGSEAQCAHGLGDSLLGNLVRLIRKRCGAIGAQGNGNVELNRIVSRWMRVQVRKAPLRLNGLRRKWFKVPKAFDHFGYQR